MSKEPQELYDAPKREINTEKTFIIFCEDKVSEPIYFKYFETSRIKVSPIEKQKSGIDNVLNAIRYCKENEMMEYQDGLLQFKENGASIWCVFDRDKSEQSDDEDFNESINIARKKGINVA